MESQNTRDRYENHYACGCGHEWSDIWSCMCDDKCPSCGVANEPHQSIDLLDIPEGKLGVVVESYEGCLQGVHVFNDAAALYDFLADWEGENSPDEFGETPLRFFTTTLNGEQDQPNRLISMPSDLAKNIEALLVRGRTDIELACDGGEAQLPDVDAANETISRFRQLTGVNLDLVSASACDACGSPIPDNEGVGCPDGAHICRACFEDGAH